VRSAIAAIGTVAAAFFAVNMLGVAVAEAPTGTPLRTISVQGVANVPIGQSENAAAATAVYREGMAGAVADGQSKATFLAGKLSATLGPVQSVVEDGGYISCSGGGESGYAEYEGEQPDFGSAPRQTAVAPAAAQLSRPAQATHGAKKKRTKRKHPRARRAAAVSCRLTAQVSLLYAIN
jgi:hypothetical protein